MLRYVDIENISTVEHDCYLTHPNRSEDTDDMVLDVANQLDFNRKDLVAWVKSNHSWNIMEDTEVELDLSDFMHELTVWINR